MQVTICCRDQNAQPSVARIELVRCLVRVALAIGSGASERTADANVSNKTLRQC